MRRVVLLLTVLWTTAFSCGGREVELAAKVKRIRIVPAEAALTPGQTLQFQVVPPSTAVSWSVAEAGGGTVTPQGLYTAPAASGVFHVVAASVANPAAQGSAVVTVTSPVVITAPTPQAGTACAPLALQATVTGSADVAVVWSAPPECGNFAADGATFTSTRGVAACDALAVAHADAAKSVQVRLEFTEPVLGVAVVPATATLPTLGQQQFGALVTTSCGTFPAGQ